MDSVKFLAKGITKHNPGHEKASVLMKISGSNEHMVFAHRAQGRGRTRMANCIKMEKKHEGTTSKEYKPGEF